MVAIDSALVETLLNMSEGETLDFKREEYRLAGASDDDKSEFVKDVLAFANAWRTTDAYILIGVEENPGGRATVVGLTHHLDDADLQQLVESKAHAKVDFEYVPLTFEGKSIAVVRIPVQERPAFLKRSFGRVKADVVYVRRSSSTVEAKPDEVARMGAASRDAQSAPTLVLGFHAPEGGTQLATTVRLTSRILDVRPREDDDRDAMADAIFSPFVRVRREALFEPSPEEVRAWTAEKALLSEVRLAVVNLGTVLARSVVVALTVPRSADVVVAEETPERPAGRLAFSRLPTIASSTSVETADDHWCVVFRIGKVQPDSFEVSDPVWIGARASAALDVTARLTGDNIPKAMLVNLRMEIETVEGHVEDQPDGDGDE